MSDIIKKGMPKEGIEEEFSGEINFEVKNKTAVLDKIIAKYRKTTKARIDMRDGITVELENYWFNIRQSNTEPKLRLNLEANSKAMMQRMVRDLTKLISSPTRHHSYAIADIVDQEALKT